MDIEMRRCLGANQFARREMRNNLEDTFLVSRKNDYVSGKAALRLLFPTIQMQIKLSSGIGAEALGIQVLELALADAGRAAEFHDFAILGEVLPILLIVISA